ncbi:MAG: excinuclease ABC subunit UvrA [Flavobacteriales bacterium AspAUS03]
MKVLKGPSVKNQDDFIQIRGAFLNNLKNIDVDIPRDRLVVITGSSGSGKSSLAFDTLYTEGQRRYVESLSSYARQFLRKLDQPKVDSIKGITPAIAIEQKVILSNPRSTIGTSTEIYDYIKLLYTRIGKTYSPVSGEVVEKDDVDDVIRYIRSSPEDTKWLLLSFIKHPKSRSFFDQLKLYRQQGYTRIKVDGHLLAIEEVLDYNYQPKYKDQSFLVIDRIVNHLDDNICKTLTDSIQTAYNEGNGCCILENISNGKSKYFSDRFERDGISFQEPNIHFFSFNNSHGSCPECDGYGKIVGIEKDLVIPNKSLSVYEDAVACWRGASAQAWKNELIKNADRCGFSIHKPYFELSDQQKNILWEGTEYFEGIHAFFRMLEKKNYKIQNRVMLACYRGKTICPSCKGKRLRKECDWVKVCGKIITDLVDMPLRELSDFFERLQLSPYEYQFSKRILEEIRNRLNFLIKIGLDYLTLNRASNTLSGGESQRINLANSLGSSLIGSTYILDEPSAGLHPRDTQKLIDLLKQLRDLGNTVIVVEHDEEIIRAADDLIDIGPGAGSGGGEIIFSGLPSELENVHTLTAQYLRGEKTVRIPEQRRKFVDFIQITGAKAYNLKNIDVKFPLHMLTFITGMSGSGKSTLVKDILYPALLRKLGLNSEKAADHNALLGDLHQIEQVEMVDQNPMGKSSRSNPATYTKAYDDIRRLFVLQKLSKRMGYKAKHFSFNLESGRCETCKGEGTVTIEMQFMADVILGCEACNGKRFKDEILEVKFHDKNIADILEMTIEEAINFFQLSQEEKIVKKLQPLQDVGLDYLKMGQASNTLSGGEIQRLKLAYFLSKGDVGNKTLFIFDEPSTGLHFHDVKKLLDAFYALIEKGHSIFVIEHNTDLIQCADWVIDLGPEGGENGGQIVAEGPPEVIIEQPGSETGKFLRKKLALSKSDRSNIPQ